MSRFLRTLLVITAIFQIPSAIAWGEVARRAALPWPFAFGALAWVLGMGSFVWVARKALMDGKRNPWAVRFIDVPLYVHWCASIVALFVTVLAALALAPLGRSSLVPSWALGGYGAGLALAVYGIVIRRAWFVIHRVEVEIDDLPPELDGLRVAHLSDLHIGTHAPRSWGMRWVRAANAEAPHLAVITGDMVTSGVEYHADIAYVVSQLRAPLGTFVSMGNHDYFGEGEPLISLIRATGVRVLRNEGALLERDGARLFLAAIDDTWTRRDDMRRALAERPAGVPTILLSHDPEKFPAAARERVDLVLSGHTHGGQIGVPFFARQLNLSKLAHNFHLGLYKRGASTLYVHPGLGVTGPPIRLGVAPAVVIHTLRRTKPA